MDRYIRKLLDTYCHAGLLSRLRIYRTEADLRPWTTGLGRRDEFKVGVLMRQAALENCETSAIGRALANAGYATKGKRASREEMAKVAKGVEVKTNIEQVKAKMAKTSGEYVPVPVESDPWSQSFKQSHLHRPVEQAVETVKSCTWWHNG
jgi:hypothetical protein